MESKSVRKRSLMPPDLDRLELGIRRLLDTCAALQARAERAEARTAELQAGLDDVAAGRLDPLQLSARVQQLEAENGALRGRLRQARASVERIRNRLQFAEEDR